MTTIDKKLVSTAKKGLYRHFDDGLTLFLRIQAVAWSIIAWSIANIIVQRNICAGNLNSCQTLLVEDRLKTAAGLFICGLILTLGVVLVAGRKPKKTDILFLTLILIAGTWVSAIVADVDILGCPKYAPADTICLVRQNT